MWRASLVCWRLLRRHLVSAGILSLGIGGSVAIFSLVDAVLLRPLPYPEQENIYLVWKVDPAAGDHVGELAYPELRDFKTSLDSITHAAVMPPSLYGYAKVLQTRASEPVQIESTPVSHDFFRVLGVTPILGRDFTSADERVGAAPVVLVSHRVWRDHFGTDRSVVGRSIRLNRESHTVVGVMGPGVDFPRGVGLWVPLGTKEFIVANRETTFLQAIVRAKPGISRERLVREVDVLFGRQASERPDIYSASQRGVVTPLGEYWTGSASVHLWIMFSASIFLLFASVVSASHLILSSVLSRRSEFATRLALGARSGQVLLEVMAEGVALAALAVVLGSGVAHVALTILTRMPADVPRLAEAALDVRSFWFAAAAATAAAISLALTSGLLISRMPLQSALREGGARLSISRGAERVRTWFIVAQAATTVTLLVMAVLLGLSYRSMLDADTGFANRDAVTMNLHLRGPSGQAVDPDARRLFYGRLLGALREERGIAAAAGILLRPLEGNIGWDVSYEFEFETRGTKRRTLPKANYEVVTPDYFNAVGTPLLEGRDFDEQDVDGAEPVVIISRTLADRIQASGHTPVGHRIRLGVSPERWHRVVGVTADARYRNVTKAGADLFVPYTQARQPTRYVVVHGAGGPQVMADLVRRRVAELDPNQAVTSVTTLGELMARNAARHRFNMLLLFSLGACGVVFAAAGIYGVIAETTAARERELAIRAALGAQRARLVREVTVRPLLFVLAGELIGLVAAVSVGAAASELLYNVSADDPVVLASVAAFVFVLSLWAAIWSALTATSKGHGALRAA